MPTNSRVLVAPIVREPNRSLRIVVLIAISLNAFPSPAHAWWGQGHRWTTQGAINHLPLPLRGFFKANQTNVVNQSGNEPPGAHYIDIDNYPDFAAGTFPRDLNVLIARYGSSFVNGNGRGPWTYSDYVSSLSAGMAAAQTPSQWQSLITTAAAMAHYIEDLHNPLHLTRNYNGQYSGNYGIHARYEGEMISRHFSDLPFEPASAIYLLSPLDFAFDGIDDHYPFVAPIMAADNLAAEQISEKGYYDVLWAETGDFTYDLFQEASLAVASSWYTAWVNAGSPRTFLAHTADFEADGDVDSQDLAVWTASFGVDKIADANSDGATDGLDFLLWQRQRTFVGSSTATPEPTGAALSITAFIATSLLRRRSRRRALLHGAAEPAPF